jgi:hypothetical protein
MVDPSEKGRGFWTSRERLPNQNDGPAARKIEESCQADPLRFAKKQPRINLP